MNIALEKTEEYVAGRLKNSYGDVFIRGNNGACSFLFLISLSCSPFLSLPRTLIRLVSVL